MMPLTAPICLVTIAPMGHRRVDVPSGYIGRCRRQQHDGEAVSQSYHDKTRCRHLTALYRAEHHHCGGPKEHEEERRYELCRRRSPGSRRTKFACIGQKSQSPSGNAQSKIPLYVTHYAAISYFVLMQTAEKAVSANCP